MLGKFFSVVTLVLLALILLAKCNEEEPLSGTDYVDDPAQIAANDEQYLDNGDGSAGSQSGLPITVPSDPRASYVLISNEKLANGNLEVVTQRSGSSGISFARREVNCSSMTFKYLGEGDTLGEAQADGPNPGQMAEAMPTSISGEISRFACSR